LAFGPEADSVEHLAMHVTTARLGVPLERDDTLPQASTWELSSGTNARFSILLCISPRRPLAALA
jgi:hypothetical protein